MNRRPAGVVICAVLLALAGAFQLLMAVFSGVAAVMAPHMPTPTQPGAPPPPPGFLLGIMIFSILFYLATAGWAGATAVGLFRMRSWARVSMIVIGAALILAGLFGAFSMFAVQFALASMPMPPNVDPPVMRIVFGLMALFALALAGVGLWWVVYFALRKTKQVFELAQPNNGTPQDVVGPAAFTGHTSSDRADQSYPTQHQANIASADTARNGRPISITVIAILLLIASLSSLFQMLSPFPLFLFGVILSGWPAHITMLVWCAVNGVSGLGLLKREKPTWILALGISCLPVVNALLMLPSGARARFAEWMQAAMERSSFGLPAPQFPSQMMGALVVLGMVFGLIVSGVILTLLWRARWAFEATVQDQAAG